MLLLVDDEHVKTTYCLLLKCYTNCDGGGHSPVVLLINRCPRGVLTDHHHPGNYGNPGGNSGVLTLATCYLT